jgi:hypothetical protein
MDCVLHRPASTPSGHLGRFASKQGKAGAIGATMCPMGPRGAWTVAAGVGCCQVGSHLRRLVLSQN